MRKKLPVLNLSLILLGVAFFTPIPSICGESELEIGLESTVYVPRRGKATVISYDQSLHGACFRGIRHLLQHQEGNGSWRNDPGLTAMSVLAIVPHWTDDPVFETEFRPGLENGLRWLDCFIENEMAGHTIDDSCVKLAASALEAARRFGYDISGKKTFEVVSSIFTIREPEHTNDNATAVLSETVQLPPDSSESYKDGCIPLFLRTFTSERFAKLSPQNKLEICRVLMLRQETKRLETSQNAKSVIGFWLDDQYSDGVVRNICRLHVEKNESPTILGNNEVMTIIDTALAIFMIGVSKDSLVVTGPDYSTFFSPIQNWLAALSETTEISESDSGTRPFFSDSEKPEGNILPEQKRTPPGTSAP